MKITKKLATKLHEGARRKNKKISVICGFIFFLIITLSLSLPVYAKTKKQEHKGKSSSFGVKSSTQSKKTPQIGSKSTPSQTPSRSTPSPGVENKKRSGGWGNSNPNQGKSGKFGRNTGKLIRHPPKPRPKPPKPIPKPPPVPPDPRPPRPPRPPCPPGPGYLPIIIDPTPGDKIEENLAPPDQGKSKGFPEETYHISDSFVPDQMLVERIEKYNAKHLHSLGLEYPLTRRSESLTYQLLDSLELIERMERKIKYYKQQLEAVRNSNLSPVERSSKELFWLERLDRLQESKQKEEERVFELRSGIEEEHRKKQRDR